MPDMSKCFSHHTNRENPLTLFLGGRANFRVVSNMMDTKKALDIKQHKTLLIYLTPKINLNTYLLDAQFIENLNEFLIHNLAFTYRINKGHINHFIITYTYHNITLTLYKCVNSTNTYLRSKYTVAS